MKPIQNKTQTDLEQPLPEHKSPAGVCVALSALHGGRRGGEPPPPCSNNIWYAAGNAWPRLSSWQSCLLPLRHPISSLPRPQRISTRRCPNHVDLFLSPSSFILIDCILQGSSSRRWLGGHRVHKMSSRLCVRLPPAATAEKFRHCRAAQHYTHTLL